MTALTTAMILAAGRGERMRPLTDNCPKPLLKVAGKALIEWHIDKLVAAGFKRVVINTAYLGQQIESYLGDGQRWNIELRYSHEHTALETAGGIKNALPLIAADPFLVINGDIWNDWDYKQLAKLEIGSVNAHLLMVENPPHNQAGDFAIANGKVLDRPEFTFSGVAVYRAAFFTGLQTGKQALAPLLRKAMSEQQVAGQLQPGQWVDVGTPQRLNELNNQLTNSRD
ncbi:N-acetylmuramate alpha-1-phosphate uridylyltransferase MurU [Agarivorans sp. MS3-6]|uniref:N-acetylmuramate alpha-1-phosphate uridylyltransferase MurU n=1 Tax=Agarivorans sp. TSD2052 TaxID=2937286 RepID=UPI00200F7626|nr:nucleotidyltransferase family protein [Agarivorans sp. TSD2052]UPW18026.1 nucleotidyltransferase family protein [Agarivorans sp. TSD2052]